MTASTTTETTVPVRRVTITTERPFDDVVAAVYAGLGSVPDFGEFVGQLSAIHDVAEYDAAVARVAGSSGLVEFLSLDLGAVLATRVAGHEGRLLRIIAGNPVTMSTMTATVPDAGSYAPVTILIAERGTATALSFDCVASAIAPYGGADASAMAEALDAAVLTLLHDAAG